MIEITNNGKKEQRILYEGWLREYPVPVIYVPSQLKIKIVASYLDKKPLPVCSIKKGFYHPWDRKEGSVEGFVTLATYAEFKALSKTKIEDIEVPKDSLITAYVPTSEGYVEAVLKTGKLSQNIHFFEPDFEANKAFVKIKSPEVNEQWIKVKCLEGHSGFIQDKEFLATAGVVEGATGLYGKVELVPKK